MHLLYIGQASFHLGGGRGDTRKEAKYFGTVSAICMLGLFSKYGQLMGREINLLMDFLTFHRNIPDWKVDLPGTCYICHHIREWILYPFRDILGTCLFRCPCGFSGKELLGLASENA